MPLIRYKKALRGFLEPPSICCALSQFASSKGNSFEALGKLTMKGVTKEIILPFSFAKNENDGAFSGSFSVIPKEYSIDKSGTPDVIEISLYIKVSKL